VNSGAWVSSAPITTGRYSTASTGTQTASLLMGGNLSPPVGYTAAVEQYNGTGWANETVIPTAIQQGAGAGTITAALFCAGFIGPPPPGSTGTFEYDGSSWTVSNVLANGRTSALSAGTQIAAMIAGGSECPAPVKLSTEEYNGTSWTAGNDMGTSRYQMMGSNVGLQTASLAIGGYGPTGPGPLNNVESYDGTNWTATTVLPVPDGNQARYGIQTAAVAAGGSYTPKVTCVEFDGSAWASMPSLATGRESNSGSGTTTAGVIGGTAPGSPFTLGYTEEYNVATTVVTPGAWASAPSLTTGRYSCAGTGTTTAALLTGGTIAPGGYTNAVEKYDGSSWTAGAVYPAVIQGGGSTGPQTAALYTGGYVSGPGIQSQTATFDGSSWTIVPGTLNNARGQSMSGCVGTTSAAMLAGGDDDGTLPYFNNTETYNGTSWTTSPGTLSSARTGITVVGTSTVAVTAGGGDAPGAPGNTNVIQTWNGSAWATSPATLNTKKIFFMKSGASSTAALFIGGDSPEGKLVRTESWDGTIAVTDAALVTATAEGGSAGPSTSAALIFGGITPLSGNSGVTQEFTGATTAANYKTITTS